MVPMTHDGSSFSIVFVFESQMCSSRPRPLRYICSFCPTGIQLGIGLHRTIQRLNERETEGGRRGGERIISAFISSTCLAHTVPEVSGLTLFRGIYTTGPGCRCLLR